MEIEACSHPCPPLDCLKRWIVRTRMPSELELCVEIEVAVLGSPSIMGSLMVFVDVIRVQELCESRGGRPGLSILTSLMVSVDVKQQ